jgi:hypothetical protein
VTQVPNSSLVPPSGHHFVDHSTGAPIRIEGTSREDVAQKVLQHRLTNRRPPGNPLEEYDAYVCGTWPHFCRDTDPQPIPGISNARPHLSLRVSTWLAGFVRSAARDVGVRQTEAERRAMICAECPRNLPYESGCGSCMDAIARLSFIWLHDRKTASDTHVKACDITGQHNRCAVHAAVLPELTAEQRAALPSNCWRAG